MNRKSQKLYQEAKSIIPGGTQLLSKRPELYLPESWPVYYERAKGCEIWDLEGNHYEDMLNMSVGAGILGYADEDVDAAVKEAVDKGNISSLNVYEEVELARELIDLHPWADMVRYSRGGGDAMAVAVRIARAYSKKDIVLFCGYHGWHDWYLSANLSDDGALDGHLLPGLEPAGVPRALKGSAYPFYYNDGEEFLKLLKKYEGRIGAVVMESVRNQEPEQGFIDIIQKETRKKDIPLVVDEVSAGFRMTCGGAHLIYGLEPDIAVFAKGISNGYPMAAVVGKKQMMTAAEDSFISSTYWTDRIGPVAALTCIRKMKELKVYQHLMDTGKKIQKGWREAADQAGIQIHTGGIYPLSHFVFEEKNPLLYKTFYTQEMLKKGFLATTAFYASFAHKEDVVNRYLNAAGEVMILIAEHKKTGDIAHYLEGPVCHSGFKRLN